MFSNTNPQMQGRRWKLRNLFSFLIESSSVNVVQLQYIAVNGWFSSLFVCILDWLNGDIWSCQLRLMIPELASASPCRWIYPLTFGGGLVGGDVISISFQIKDHCAALVTSQESTKVGNGFNLPQQDMILWQWQNSQICMYFLIFILQSSIISSVIKYIDVCGCSQPEVFVLLAKMRCLCNILGNMSSLWIIFDQLNQHILYYLQGC